jgi:hypothetical protein
MKYLNIQRKILIFSIITFIVIFFVLFGGLDFFFPNFVESPINFIQDLFFDNSRFLQIFNINYFDSYLDFLFGNGLVKIPVYLPSYFQIIYSFGFIGLLLFIVLFVSLIKHKAFIQKLITIIFLFLNIGTEIIFGNFALYFFSFIISDYDK